MPIRILPAEVASQIAAGEVIERPASVVKELIENAIDANANSIKITVQGAGKSLIEVVDDGIGIPAQELPLAVERHATSKLDQASDLFKIATLGFRGEALASIGSVSRMTITARTKEAELGCRLRVEGSQVYPVQSIGAPPGTSVKVENLFYNLPARLKFLKTDSTERRLIDNLATRYALAYPTVRFHLLQEDRSALQSSGNGDRREVLGSLYGVDTARVMLTVLYKDDFLSIEGFISPTSITRTHRREIHFFVNGRPVQDSTLIAALIKGYQTLLMVGRFPVATLFLEMPTEGVDVNVHPTKAEVRFREPDRIFGSVQSAVRRALLAHNPVPGLLEDTRWGGGFSWSPPLTSAYPTWHMDTGESQPIDKPAIGWEDQDFSTPAVPPLTTTLEGSQPALPNQRVPILRPVGQIALAFLVAEGPDGLYLIDQHAAHERVLFEHFMAMRANPIPSQSLLQPVTVELTSANARLLTGQMDLLNRLGFQIEEFGPDTFLVRRVPALLVGTDPSSALRSLVENFEEDETPLQNQVEARLIARICKRSAIKAGASLTPEEQRSLLLDLENCQSPRTCPHGRPTMIHLSVDLLERQFGRKGAR
jgi:DNA mismatch repair protein MutL